MKPVFQKKLQFGDIWRRNRQKIAQIEVFSSFLDCPSLLFLDFAINGKWAWCLVAFLQFARPVNVFLLSLYSARIYLKNRVTSFGDAHTLVQNCCCWNLSVEKSLMLDDPSSVPFLCNLKCISLHFGQNSMQVTFKLAIPFKASHII